MSKKWNKKMKDNRMEQTKTKTLEDKSRKPDFNHGSSRKKEERNERKKNCQGNKTIHFLQNKRHKSQVTSLQPVTAHTEYPA